MPIKPTEALRLRIELDELLFAFTVPPSTEQECAELRERLDAILELTKEPINVAGEEAEAWTSKLRTQARLARVYAVRGEHPPVETIAFLRKCKEQMMELGHHAALQSPSVAFPSNPEDFIPHLDNHYRTFLSSLNRQLENFDCFANLIAERILDVQSANPRDDKHVNLVLHCAQDTKSRLPEYHQLERNMTAAFRIEHPVGLFAHPASFFVTVPTWRVRETILSMERLLELCHAFLCSAARFRGIIGTGAPLSEEARMELAFTVNSKVDPPNEDEVSVPPPALKPDGEHRLVGIRQAVLDAAAAAAHPTVLTPPVMEKPPADPFAELRQFARDKLKGQGRAVIEALCDAGGELPIADLGTKDSLDWTDDFEGFANARKRLNPKLKRIGWTISRQNNTAKLGRIRG